MKTPLFFSVLLLGLLVTSCQYDAEGDSAKTQAPENEIITSRIGSDLVYGARMRLYEEQAGSLNYLVQLSVGAEVWIDTVEIAVPAKDTLEYDLIFPNSRVGSDDLTQLTIKKLSLEH